MGKNRLEAARARLADAIPGPWRDDVTDDGRLMVFGPIESIAYIGDMEETDKWDHRNAAFIAHAPTDLERALAVVSALVEQSAHWHDVCPLCGEHAKPGYGEHAQGCPLAWWEGDAE